MTSVRCTTVWTVKYVLVTYLQYSEVTQHQLPNVVIIKCHVSGCSSKSILWAWFWKYLLSVLLLYFLVLYCIVLDQYKRNLYSFSKLIGRYWRTLYLATQSSVVWYRVSLLPKEEEGDGNSLFCFCHAIICALLSLFLHSSFR